MTIGVGGVSKEQALAGLQDMTQGAQPIGLDEYRVRLAKAQAYMQANGIAALYLNAGTSLNYFTGLKWYASERMVGAILPAHGALEFIAPWFEVGTLHDYMQLQGEVNALHEHESPYALFVATLALPST